MMRTRGKSSSRATRDGEVSAHEIADADADTDSQTALLTVQNLKLQFGNNIVIKSASFTILAGDFVCIVGANGAGKSTLVKGLLGLIKPAGGKIIYGTGIQPSTIGYLPQEVNTNSHFPALVREVVLSGNLGRMGGKPFYGLAERERADTAMARMQVTGLEDRSFGDLSGGQKQKVLLARALTATSELIILDEPASSLDHASRAELYKVLRRLNREGIGILMITHDIDADDLIGNKVLAVTEGSARLTTRQAYLEEYERDY